MILPEQPNSINADNVEAQSLLHGPGEERGGEGRGEEQREMHREQESKYGPSKNSTCEEGDGQEAVTGASYANFVRTNVQFVLLWCGSMVSLTGDWLTEIACLTLLGEHKASPIYVSIFLLSKEVPNSVWAPFTGVVADIFDRRKIMVGADLVRIVVVLCYLLVMKMESGAVWTLIGISFLQTSIASFFTPASLAFIPSIVPPNQLLIAETLQGATWSAVLLLGAALGGLFSIVFGIAANFVTDAATYLLSAILLSYLFKYPYQKGSFKKNEDRNVSQPPTDENPVQEEVEAEKIEKEVKTEKGKSVVLGSVLVWLSMLKSAVLYLRTHRYILIICCVKFCGGLLWNGYDLVNIEYAQKYFTKGGGGELSLSLLYIAGGIGSWLGPFFPTVLIADTSRNNLLSLLCGWWLMALGCFCSAFVPNLFFACAVNTVRSAGVGLLWTYSEVIKDKLVPGEILGRVSAFELALIPIASVISRFAVSYGLEHGFDAFKIAFVLGIIGLALCIIWTCIIVRILRR